MRVAREVVATQPLDRHDRTVGERSLSGGDGSVRAVDRSRRRLEPQPRPARRARDGLGVEPPVDGVVILRGARRAQREAAHRRVRAVVREPARDREARTAVGAVDERIAVAAIGGVVQLAEAVVAHRHVGRRRTCGRRRRRCSRRCGSRAPPPRSIGRRLDGVDAGQRRPLDDESSLERGRPRSRRPRPRRTRRRRRCRRARRVASPVAKRCTNGRKPDPLNHPAHADPVANGATRRPRRRRHAGRPSVTAASR